MTINVLIVVSADPSIRLDILVHTWTLHCVLDSVTSST
jgi:hypothetical protein